jgi:hypothetical protein
VLVKLLFALTAMLFACDPTPDPSRYPPPFVSCTANDPCTPPPSVCAEEHWIVYYDDGVCEKNQCAWTTKFFECRGGDQCISGACEYNGETAPYRYGP